MAPVSGLTTAIKTEAVRLGFSLVGVTQPSQPQHLQTYLNWLSEGRHGQMAYLATEHARQVRNEPSLIFPGCRSVISLAVHYPPLPFTGHGLVGTEHNPRGLIASYARGADYHDSLPPRLNALAEFISSTPRNVIRSRPYTDTGPILERDMAQQAGLGWIGKNTCLVHPRLGSFFLLAELFTEIFLEPDAPFLADRCGSCTRCIQACPTGCILPDRTIDARRCISYLTIELKGSIPVELRRTIGQWVFGCDICQMVCPWNQHAARNPDQVERDPAFLPRPGPPDINLIEELSLSPQAFNLKFRNNPVRRPHRRGYLRNVAIVLGNSGSPAAIPVLAQTLRHDPEPLVRGAAAWALGQIGGAFSRQALESVRSAEPDQTVLSEISAALQDHQNQSG